MLRGTGRLLFIIVPGLLLTATTSPAPEVEAGSRGNPPREVEDCCAALLTGTSYVPTKEWILFSIPLLPALPAAFFELDVLEDDLGIYYAHMWSAEHWLPGTGDLATADRFDVARGYFLRDNVGAVGESTLVDVDGGVLEYHYPFTVVGLDSGWQELGNPYLTAIAWDGAISITGPGETTVSLDSAATLGWIAPTLWKFTSAGTWEFFFAGGAGGDLEPWEAGLILPRIHGLSLGFPPPGDTPLTAAAPPYDWRVELVAEAAGLTLTDDHNFLGMMPGASSEHDPRDVLGPFRLDDYLELAFDNRHWTEWPGLYQQDIRPPAGGMEIWSVSVTLQGQTGENVDIRWPDLSQVPELIGLHFVDPGTADTLDMRSEPSYAFVSGPSGEPYALEILVDPSGASEVAGEGNAVPAVFYLAQNRPNPFNPMTEILFGVPLPGGEVSLGVYNVRGQLVRELWRGWAAPGRHTVLWGGESEEGLPVESGLYFCCLCTTARQETRKLMLLR